MREYGPFYQLTGKKVETVIKESGLTQEQFAERLPSKKAGDGCVSNKVISRIVRGHVPLSEKMAQKIIKAFPEKGYNLAWLLGYSEDKTMFDSVGRILDKSVRTDEILIELIKLNDMEIFNADCDFPGATGQLERAGYSVDGAAISYEDFHRIALKVRDFVKFELQHPGYDRPQVSVKPAVNLNELMKDFIS